MHAPSVFGLGRFSQSVVLAMIAASLFGPLAVQASPTLTVEPVADIGFDVLADGQLVAPVRFSSTGALFANTVSVTNGGIRLSGLRCRDPLAVAFGPDDFVSITLPGPTPSCSSSSVSPILTQPAGV